MNTLDSKPRLKYRQTCAVCGDILESEHDRYPYNEYSTICSELCHKKAKEIYDKKYYTEWVVDIPLKYRDIKTDNKMAVDNYGKNLFITGKSGVGKTILASLIAKECIKHKMPFQWLNYSAFIMELQNLYKFDNESPFEVAEKISRFDGVLILDDLGSEKLTDFVRQITYFLVNEREQRMLPIVITSNFSLEEIANQIDIRISSRIAGMCKAIKLSGKDRRLDDNNKQWVVGDIHNKLLNPIIKYRKP